MLLKIITAIFLIIPFVSWYVSIKEFQFSIYFFVRLIGLYAFTLLSFYLIIDLWSFVFNKIFNYKKLEHHKNLFRNIALLLIFAHPIVYFLSYFPSKPPIDILVPFFVRGEYKLSFAFASLAFYSILIYLTLKFFNRHKNIADIFIYVAFFFSFIHSYLFGSEVKSFPVIYMWPIYVVIVLAGIIRVYIIKD